MPYIHRHSRERLELGESPLNAGELNYLITLLCIEYGEDRPDGYTTYNEIIGALECAKLEFSRRVVAPYEDEKIEENGDVYET
jgi:hypothetical protein